MHTFSSPWLTRGRLLVGWLTLFVIGTDLFVVSPLLPLIAKHYVVSVAMSGWMVTAFAIMYMGAAPWLGSLADRLGRRQVLVTGLVGFALANGLTSIAPSFVWLLGSRLLAGLAAAAITPSIYALIGDVAPSQKRGSWLGLIGSGLLIALTVGAPLGSLGAAAFGWKVIFSILAVSSVLLAVGNWRIWPASFVQQRAAAQVAGRLTLSLLVEGVGSTVLWGTALYGVYTYLGVGLRTAAQFSASQEASLLVCYGLGTVFGSLAGGTLSDRFGAKRIMLLSLVCLAVSFVFIRVFLLLPVAVFVGFILAACSAQLFFPAQQARIAQRFPERRGTLLAWNNSALYLGIALGSVMGGVVVGMAGFATVLVVCSGMSILGSIVTSVFPAQATTRQKHPLPGSEEGQELTRQKQQVG